MEDMKRVVQFFCTVVTLGFFSTGALTCLKIRRQMSVGDVNAIPFVMTALNCILNSGYGVVVDDATLFFVNGIGALMHLVYIAVFFMYLDDTSAKKKYIKIIGAAAAVLAAASFFIAYKSQYCNQKDNLGVTCNIVTILMFASPLSTLGKVIRTKSTSSISFPLSFMVVLVSVSWLSYGLLLGDIYVQIPNYIGAALGVIQLSLFFIYPSTASKIHDAVV
ncbi:sugar transporter SWEET1-like [Rhopilema esculentum]|uniref:sugar transporter SWEET1-like n=1 Tax=Rhopilema esculentum TaxID=499914 RepID=UPI0031D91BAE